MSEELRPKEWALLKAASMNISPGPLQVWRVYQVYERLEQRGLVAEVKSSNHLVRQFKITHAGREML